VPCAATLFQVQEDARSNTSGDFAQFGSRKSMSFRKVSTQGQLEGPLEKNIKGLASRSQIAGEESPIERATIIAPQKRSLEFEPTAFSPACF
jgi:hypothetical protein